MNLDIELVARLVKNYCQLHDISPAKRLIKLELYIEPSCPFELEVLEYLKKRNVYNVEGFVTWYLVYLSKAPLPDDWLKAILNIHNRLITL